MSGKGMSGKGMSGNDNVISPLHKLVPFTSYIDLNINYI